VLFLKKIPTFLLLLFLLLVTFLIYVPGLQGDFIFDDYVNIVTNDNAHLDQLSWAEVRQLWSSGVATAISRPLSMLSFGLNYYLTNLNPFYFKLTNVLIHLLTSVGIYLLAIELFRIGLTADEADANKRRLLALLVAGCWALHPLNVSTVLYVVQRMTQLSALVSVYTLLYYCKFRQREHCSQRAAVLFLALLSSLIVIGVLFKENALLVVLFIFCIEMFLLRFRTHNEGHRLFIKLFLSCLIALPAVGVIALLFISPESVIGSYELRTFTVWERLLTEARVIWWYIGWVLIPDNREMVFYYDTIVISRSLLDPISTLFAVLALIGLFAFLIAVRKRAPILAFGIAFFLAGHAMESTIIGLELVFEHRNYLPAFGLLFGCIYTLLSLPQGILRTQAAAGVLGIYLLFLAHGTFEETRKWSSTFEHLSALVELNPDSHRTNYGMGYFLLGLASQTPNNAALLDLAAEYFGHAAKSDDKAIRGHVGIIQANSQNGKPIDPAIVDELMSRVQTTPKVENYLVEISTLTECWYAGFCKFDNAILARLYNSIASNGLSEPVAKQGILFQLATAALDVFNRREDGRAILYLARNVRFELTVIDLRLIELEIELANYAEARTLLAEAKVRPGPASFADNLAALQQALELADGP
jgi:hypothetical protein